MRINVLVKPNSKRGDLVVSDNNGITVFLRAKPRENAANLNLIKVLSKHFSVPKTSIRIIAGHKSRQKIVEIS